jgi:hypothetical protein
MVDVSTRAGGRDTVTDTARDALRKRLAGPLDQLVADALLARDSLRGPDPEHAVEVLILALADINAALSGARFKV